MNRREAIAALTALPALKSIAVANVGPSDVIVAECEGLLTECGRSNVEATLKRIWPDNRVLVCDGAVRIKVLRG